MIKVADEEVVKESIKKNFSHQQQHYQKQEADNKLLEQANMIWGIH